MENVPEALRFITPYYQRSKELKNHEPVIAYYCNYYAAKLAIAKGAKDKECQLFLVTLLDNLEQEKRSLGDNEAVNDDDIGKAYIESFAVKVFLNADNEDRAGKASKKTVKTFLAASIFLELLKIFGEIDPEIEEKIKYSKWKATDIMKALKEGRTPHPGPPGWEPTNDMNEDASINESPTADDSVPKIQDFPAPPNFPPQFDQHDQQNFNSPTAPPSQSPFDETNKQEFNNLNSNPSPYQSPPQNFPSFPEFPSNLPGHVSHDGPSSQSSYDQGQTSFGRNDFNEPSDPYGNQHMNNSPHNSNPETGPNFNSGSSHYPSNDPYGYNMRPAQPDYQPQPSFQPPQQPYQQQPQQYRQEPSQDMYTKLDIDPKAISTAQKHSRFAISALEYDDVKTAVENLRKALMILEPYNRK
ncbi:DUF605-domain-containing protein [Basidiobolus meristosporus CBS 931.73]|uniref:DUF605-domain-containing protein n=1 Tax=Basidiobolus meristosporus CBS 931.73 TaxID=1314790 RepID=A0A1Y1YZ08_9FUNG|nr:DUF605-domain-containing protein [Basidiobolus meristosporus CBS 931.73]|eukprot:ORY03189.1 DUF605-domain-containing protein [Basidiobolus meristosporus CBS 931.73]